MTLALGAMAAFATVAGLGWILGVSRVEGGAPLMRQGVQAPSSPGITGVVPSVVRESSGVAVSGIDTSILWTHNDGKDGRVYRMGFDGVLRSTVRVVGVEVDDVEDIAIGPCPESIAEASCIYLADTGDNDRDRAEYAVLVAAEPVPDSESRIASDLTFSQIRFAYPNGSRDAESLALAPDGALYIITKGQEGDAEVFRVPSEPTGNTIAEAESIGRLPVDVDDKGLRPTAAAHSPSRARIAVRSDEKLFVFSADDFSRPEHRCSLPDSRQGEGLDFVSDNLFVVTSEGSRSPIEIVQCP